MCKLAIATILAAATASAFQLEESVVHSYESKVRSSLFTRAPTPECPVQFEFLQLQDISLSFSPVVDNIEQLRQRISNEMRQDFAGSSYGLAAFSDKPTPMSGYGLYAAFPENGVRDVCYKQIQPLTVDAANQPAHPFSASGGADFPENGYGAIIDASLDPTSGWTNAEVDPETKKPIIRVLFVVTDSISHIPGDANVNIDKWNELWGTADMPWWAVAWGGKCALETENWKRAEVLMKKYREGAATLSPQELEELQGLWELCGPYPYAHLAPNSGAFNSPCDTTEYPSRAKMAEAMRAVGFDGAIPVLVTPTTLNQDNAYIAEWGGCGGEPKKSDGECVGLWWKEQLEAEGLKGLFYTLDTSADVPTLAAIANFAINELHDVYCGFTTTAAPSTALSTLPVPPTPTSAVATTTTTDQTGGGEGSPVSTPPRTSSATVPATLPQSTPEVVQTEVPSTSPATGCPPETPCEQEVVRLRLEDLIAILEKA